MGTQTDFTDLHAWAEVYIPGAGWIGVDATSGLLCGEGHVPLAATPHYRSAAPITGLASRGADHFEFEMNISRMVEPIRITKPFEDAVWDELDALGRVADSAAARGRGDRRRGRCRDQRLRTAPAGPGLGRVLPLPGRQRRPQRPMPVRVGPQGQALSRCGGCLRVRGGAGRSVRPSVVEYRLERGRVIHLSRRGTPAGGRRRWRRGGGRNGSPGPSGSPARAGNRPGRGFRCPRPPVPGPGCGPCG